MSTLLVRLAPAGLGVILGVVVAVAGQNGTFVVRTPLVTVLVVTGMLVSGVLLGLNALLLAAESLALGAEGNDRIRGWLSRRSLCPSRRARVVPPPALAVCAAFDQPVPQLGHFCVRIVNNHGLARNGIDVCFEHARPLK